jgi:hypothetical protein
MIDTIYIRLVQYWETFIGAPIEMKVMLGFAAIVAGMALKSVWRIILPARWVTALSLRSIARVLHRPSTKNRPVLQGPLPLPKHHSTSFTFELNNIKNIADFKKLLKSYRHNIGVISNEDLDLCSDLAYAVGIDFRDSIYKPFFTERRKRQKEKELKDTLNRRAEKKSLDSKESNPVYSGEYILHTQENISSDSLASSDKEYSVSGCVPTPPPNRVMYGY